MCEHKLGPVQQDGYQYCNNCGLGIVAECKHDWVEFDTLNWTLKGLQKIEYVLQCSKCGELSSYIANGKYEEEN